MTEAEADPTTIFTSKANIFDRFRWDYASEAIEFILNRSTVDISSSMADIGSGTGILTRHFLNEVGIVYALEPNQAMRRVAEERQGDNPSFRSMSTSAEYTTLLADSLDLIVIGQALHWFDPEQTAAEFVRVLKSDGWLAVIWNKIGEGDLSQALENIFAR